MAVTEEEIVLTRNVLILYGVLLFFSFVITILSLVFAFVTLEDIGEGFFAYEASTAFLVSVVKFALIAKFVVRRTSGRNARLRQWGKTKKGDTND